MVPVLRSCQSPTWIWLVNYLHLRLHLGQCDQTRIVCLQTLQPPHPLPQPPASSAHPPPPPHYPVPTFTRRFGGITVLNSPLRRPLRSTLRSPLHCAVYCTVYCKNSHAGEASLSSFPEQLPVQEQQFTGMLDIQHRNGFGRTAPASLPSRKFPQLQQCSSSCRRVLRGCGAQGGWLWLAAPRRRC